MISLQKDEGQLTNDIMRKVNLSKDKDELEKHVVSLSKTIVSLSKDKDVDIGSTRAKVVVALDYSYSMTMLYNNGTVQQTLNKLVPLGLTFDDNGAIDVFLFEDEYKKFEDLTLDNYADYVEKVIKKSGYTMGGTSYAPVLNGIVFGGTHKEQVTEKKLFGLIKKTTEKVVESRPIVDSEQPTFVIFITDGDNADKYATTSVIRALSSKNVFVQFIGIGYNEDFTFLKKLDTIKNRVRDNTGFTKLKSLEKATDDELYASVLEQFADWLKNKQ